MRILKAFENGSLANITSKTQLHTIGQSGKSLDRRLKPLLITGLPLIRIVIKPLAKRFLIPLGIAAAATADPVIHKKMFGSGNTTLISSNEQTNNIMNIVKSLEESTPPHPLTYFEIQKYYQNEPKFNGVYSKK